MTEIEAIKIIKEYFNTNKVEIYKRKLTSPMSYEAIIIAIMDKRDIENNLKEFLKNSYSLNDDLIFDSSEAMIEASDIKINYLFFKANINKGL